MKKTLAALMLAVSLAACGPTPTPQLDAAGNVVQQAQSSGPGWLGAAGAGVLGYMMGKSAGRNQAYQTPTTIIRERVLPPRIEYPRYSPPVPRTYSSPAPSRSFSTPSRSSSSFSGSRSITRRR